MAPVFTEGKHAGEGIMSEAPGVGALSREVITIASGAGVIAPMTVLGKITATGKYIPSPASEVVGSEGAETADAVNIYGVDATSADVEVTAIVRNAVLNGHELTYDASRNLAGEQLAARVDLAAKDVIVRL